MIKTHFRLVLISLFIVSSGVYISCGQQKNTYNKKLSVLMARSAIKRNPKAWMLDFSKQPQWGYCHGVVGKAMLDLWGLYNLEEFYNYIEEFTNAMVLEDGSIQGYNPDNYNIDRLNSGKLLFPIYEKTKDEKYLKAIHLLRSQLYAHPRTKEGGFWHKKNYPHQMWLDGLYMGTPFYAQYSNVFNEDNGFNDIANQIHLVRTHLYDSTTGLYMHGWDESHAQEWSDSVTGQSQNIWGRGVGWFAMSLVDVLDFFPENHPNRKEIVGVLNDLALAIINFQDSETGVWFQVMDLPNSNGNYLESTASTMFAYVLLKGIRMGYLDEFFKKPAIKAYKGIVEQFIREENDNTLSITNCCAGAGLGGKPYRSGTFEYYIKEQVRDNDPKAVGPFILASLEYERLTIK